MIVPGYPGGVRASFEPDSHGGQGGFAPTQMHAQPVKTCPSDRPTPGGTGRAGTRNKSLTLTRPGLKLKRDVK